MANKVMFGLKNVYVAFITNEATPTYGTPTAIPGAVNLSLSTEGESSNFYADDVAYYTTQTNNGYTGDLEMALIPDATLATMLGWDVDDDGMLVEIADGEATPFALMFEVSGNEADKRYVLYKCVASRPGVDASTKSETTEPKSQTLSLTCTPIEIDGQPIVKAAMEYSLANATAYNAFFGAVKTPTFSVS